MCTITPFLKGKGVRVFHRNSLIVSALALNSTLREVNTAIGDAYARHPLVCVWIVALEEAEHCLLCNNLRRSLALKALAHVSLVQHCEVTAHEEEHMLAILLIGVNLGETQGVLLVSVAHGFCEVGHSAIV